MNSSGRVLARVPTSAVPPAMPPAGTFYQRVEHRHEDERENRRGEQPADQSFSLGASSWLDRSDDTASWITGESSKLPAITGESTPSGKVP